MEPHCPRWPLEPQPSSVEQWARTEAPHPHRCEDLLCRAEWESRQRPWRRSTCLTAGVLLCLAALVVSWLCVRVANIGRFARSRDAEFPQVDEGVKALKVTVRPRSASEFPR